jgi:arylsulfatase A-like enzyme
VSVNIRAMRKALLVALLGTAACTLASGCGKSERPNILLIVVDTLRADHLTSYGYHRDTAPEIERLLAERGVVVEQAIVQAPWTLPSMASMLTGFSPERMLDVKQEPWGIPTEVETLAERLQSAGYRTAAFIANPTLHAGNGYSQGFDTFVTAPYELASMSKHAEEINAQVLPWLALAPAEPFFLYVHYLDPHDPYENADIVEGRSPFFPDYAGKLGGGDVHGLYTGDLTLTDAEQDHQQLAALYDAEIRYVDRYIGQLLAAIPPDVLASSLVVLTADHGEELLDHGGYKHGETLYQEQLHVPLIVRWDGVIPSRGRLTGRVPLLDLWPTAVAAAQASRLADGREGINLLPYLKDLREPPPRDIFARHLARGPLRAARLAGRTKEILFDRHAPYQPADEADRRIWQRDVTRLQRLEVYDLHRDRNETTPLAPIDNNPPLALLARIDRGFDGLRVVATGLRPGQTLTGRVETGARGLNVRPLFLAPEDLWNLENGVLTFTLHGDGVAKGFLIDGDLARIESLVADLDGHPCPIVSPGGRTIHAPIQLRDLLVADATVPTPLTQPTLQLWIRRPDPSLGAGIKDDETIRRLKALGYAG